LTLHVACARIPNLLSSRQHPIVKTFREVARGDARLALLDGWHLLHDAAAARIEIETVAFSGKLGDEQSALIQRLSRRAATKVVEVSSAVMDVLTPVRTPSGIAAIVRRPAIALPQLLRPAPALVIVAVDMQDPGNAGAIVRSAEAGGATGVIFTGRSADPWSWKALRAGMGSTFRLPVLRQPDTVTIIESLRKVPLAILATVPRAGNAIYDTNLREPVAILLGSEGTGLETAVLDVADARMSIPMEAAVDSLNAAVAAGLVVYEARRQRRQ